MSPEREHMGRLAYEAYRARRYADGREGFLLPWNEVAKTQKQAWCDAAEAVAKETMKTLFRDSPVKVGDGKKS